MEDLISQVRNVLSTSAPCWQNLTANIPLDLLNRKPSPDEWSALECLQHLIDGEKWIFPSRVQAFLDGKNFPGFNPYVQGSKLASKPSPKIMADEFALLRAKSLELLKKVKPADLSRTAHHEELGQVSLAEMLNEWAGHDLMHIVQAERALLQPFIAGCGPWKPYFKDHDVEAQQLDVDAD
jgi:hypothetical protein